MSRQKAMKRRELLKAAALATSLTDPRAVISPTHVCAWSHQKRTDLRYDSNCFRMTGAALPALLRPYIPRQLRWYSMPHGGIYGGERENLTLIAVEPDTPVLPREQRPMQNGPLNSRLRGLATVPEYALTDRVRAALHIGGEEERYEPLEWTHIACAVQLHDECFASVRPVDRYLLLELVHGALAIQSFFLGRAVEWEWVRAEVTGLLEQTGAILFESLPDEEAVLVHRSALYQEGSTPQPQILLARLALTGTVPRFEAIDGAR